jgi:hypothetical protein
MCKQERSNLNRRFAENMRAEEPLASGLAGVERVSMKAFQW